MKRTRKALGVLLLGLLLTAGFALQASAKLPSSATEISASKAKSIALKNAKQKKADVKRLKAEKDTERGVAVYEVSFRTKYYDYEYDIRRVDGKIIGKEVKLLKKTAGSGSKISKAKAKKLILAHASKRSGKKLTGSTIKPKCGKENGIPVYEAEFKEKGLSFEYEIHARTGKVLEYEIEWPAK